MNTVSRMAAASSYSSGTPLSMAEIAELAKVKRPVVSTWRRRHDFPQPISQTGGRPLFDGEEVVEWLIDTRRGNATAEELRADLVLHGIAAYADRTDPLATIQTLGALLCLRHFDDRPLIGTVSQSAPEATWDALLRRASRLDPEDDFVLRELKSANGGVDRLTALAAFAENLVEAAYGERGAYEALLAARGKVGLAELAADALLPAVRSLVVDLADLPARLDSEGSAVLAAPHAGAGDLLISLIRAAESPESLTALAADPDEGMARIVRRRLLLAGIDELALDVQAGQDLEERLADPDVVVVQLPYTPSEGRSAMHVLESLDRLTDLIGSGRTALVLGPAAVLLDGLPDAEEAQFRLGLLRTGLVESVVALPGGLLPYRPGYRLALWTLTRDPVQATTGRVLLADVSTESLSETVRARLAEDILLWRAEGFRELNGHDPRYGRAVRVADLRSDPHGPLLPKAPPASQILARAVAERPALITAAEARSEEAAAECRTYEATRGPYRGHVVQRTGNWPARTTVGTLIADGRLTKIKGHRVDGTYLSVKGHHPVIGPEEITGRAPLGARRMDRFILNTVYEHVALTEPGDVLYSLTPEPAVRIDHDGFALVTFPARILRVNRDVERALTPRVLAALLGVARGTGRSPGAVRPARRIEDWQLPDLDHDDIRRYDEVLADIEHRENLLRAQADALAEARGLTAAGLADGTLTIHTA